MLSHIDDGDFTEVTVTPHVETHAHSIAVAEVGFGHHCVILSELNPKRKLEFSIGPAQAA